MVGPQARALVDVVGDSGRAALHRLDGADHGAQINVARCQLKRAQRAHIIHPELERQVVLAPFVEAFVAVGMTRDQARRGQEGLPPTTMSTAPRDGSAPSPSSARQPTMVFLIRVLLA